MGSVERNSDENIVRPKRDGLFIRYKGKNWKLHDLIAKGGFSKVYEAKSDQESGTLACKVAV